MDIHPTHDCFTDALELFDALLRSAWSSGVDARPDLRLVHAICKASNERFSHAWVEDDVRHLALFVGIVDGERQTFGAPVDEYRAHYEVQEDVRYTYQQAIRLNRKSRHYGPWEHRFSELCSDKPIVFDSEAK